MYLNLIQIAESFGVAESVVQGWIRNEALPTTEDRGRLLFDRAQVAEWAAKRGLAAQAGFLAPSAAALGTHLRLGALARGGGIWRDVPAAGVTSVFERIITSLPGASQPVRQMLAQRVRNPGGITLAPVGHGFALPHPATRITLGRDSGTLALLFLRDPLPHDDAASDDEPITRLCFFVAPSPRAHLEMLGRLSRGLSRPPFRDLMKAGAEDAALLAALDRADAEMAGATPSGGPA